MAVCPDGHESTATDFCDTCGIRIEGAPSSAASAATGSLSSGVAGTGGTAGPAGAQCPQCGTERSGQFCEVCGYDYATGAAAQPPGPASLSSATPGLAGPGLVSTGTATPAPGTLGPAAADPTQARATPSAPVPSAPVPSGLGPSGPDPGGAAPPAAATFRADPDQAAPEGTGQSWSVVVTADRAYFDDVISSGGPDATSIQFPAYCPERRFQLTGREVRIGRRSASRGLEPEIDLTGPPADPGVSHLHAVLIAQPDGTWSVLDPGSSNGTQVNGIDIVSGVQVPLHDGDHILLGAWTRLTIETS